MSAYFLINSFKNKQIPVTLGTQNPAEI